MSRFDRTRNARYGESRPCRVGVISAGAWGTAIAKTLASSGVVVELWNSSAAVVDDINKTHQNSRYLPGIELPRELFVSNDLVRVASGKEFIILATPSLYLAEIVKRLAEVPDICSGYPVIGILTKGFIAMEEGPCLILDAVGRILPAHYEGNLVYISGPSHAEEVGMGKITGLISASQNGKNSIKFRELLSVNPLVVFSSLDVVGVQTCGAVKNVIAVAFGILDALMEEDVSFGDNTESLLLASGLNEIQKIGTALGSEHPETFTSIAGVGDLDVTCRSEHGRNRRFGREIVKDQILDRFNDLDDLIDNWNRLGYLSEGVVATKLVHQLATDKGLKLPICKCVHSILNKEVSPQNAVRNLILSMTTTKTNGFIN